MGAAWAAAIGGLLAAGTTAYGASQQGGTVPPERSYRRLTKEHLGLLDNILLHDRLGSPAWTQLETKLTRQGLAGVARLLKDAQPVAHELERGRVGRELDLVSEFAPGARDVMRNYRPGGAAIMEELEAQAQSDLAAGMELTPMERRAVEQNVRGGQAARGFGLGPNDAVEEAVALTVSGNEALDRRRRFAGNVVSAGSDFWGDPWARIYGGSGAGPTTSADVLGQGRAQVRHIPWMAPGQPNVGPYTPVNPGANAAMAAGGALMGAAGQLGAYWMRNNGNPSVPVNNRSWYTDWSNGQYAQGASML